MLVNKTQYQKAHTLTDSELERLEDCCEDGIFQDLDEFLSEHPEIPNNEFVVVNVGGTTSSGMIVGTTEEGKVVFPIEAYSFRGSWDKGTLEYAFVVDTEAFEQAKISNFKGYRVTEKHKTGYGLKGIRSAKCTFEPKPRYDWDPSF